ncbi:hypothetical protein AAZX31_19G215300 [Glycine max]|uniref:DUF4378 domain-containing protein n=1 Tax=Glycine soja TaxID=3848 RepID=A0A445FKF2_GLYSO|nr:uncharacterized protein LOC114400622 [Glycine soja]KAH1079160.1 hypothetical protein GYH30_053956 [Glycine max]KAH1195845.1 hypothetical protein GmHk_19G056256 [Glycine max]RZB49317.1 hypothetical protein D0Y65_052325 [Glycine soja]
MSGKREMEMEKKRSKGSFLSLFDWNSKSRKKLVWNDPEVPKQGKENVENLPKSQLTRKKVDEIGESPSNIQSCDFDSTLSICSDEGCGSKAPGLVARLMGLDLLPAAAVTELSCTSLYGSKSHGASHCNEGALHSADDFCPADYINTLLKPEKSSLDAMESRARKVESLPIKRFQTEMLPPKSAKTIPVTHNKLLSPIKSPSILPPKNADHVMEAAAKIIEASPRPYLRNRTTSTEPSSVPLRILNLKERFEAAQYASMPGKLVNLSNAYPANGRLSERNSNLYKCTSAVKGSRGSEKNSSCHLASKGKSVSLTAKNNAHSRDTLISNDDIPCMKQKEKNEIKSNQLSRSHKPSTQKTMQQRPCSSRNSNVLGQNNQKQNSMTAKGKSTSKIDSNKLTTRASSSETSGIRKTTNKGTITANIQPKRSSTRATDNQKQFSRSKTVSISQKKKISKDVHEGRGPDNAVNNFGSKSIKCNFTTDGSFDQDAFNMIESKDVISFTFTSPLRRTMPESSSSTEQVMGTRNRIDVNSLGHSDNLYPKKLSLSPPGQPMIDSDALSVLLDKKLQELASRINLPQCTLAREGSSTGLRSSVQDQVPSVSSTTPKEQNKSFCSDLSSDKLDSMHNSHYCSSDDPVLNMNQQLQTSEVSEDPSCSSNSERGNDLVCWHSTAVAGFETPFVCESYLDSEDSAYGSTVYSSTQDEEVSSFSQISEPVSLESEVKGSEESSSPLGGGKMTIKQISEISNSVDFKRSRNTVLEYVHDILCNAEFMAEEFVMGQTSALIMPNVFDLLENQHYGTENFGEEYSMLERKAIFDCASELLELRCKEAFVGTCKAWSGWMMLIQRKSWMAEELYKELLGFRSMEEVMVDELVTKDMSSGCGKWLDFDVEAFEEGLEIEGDILSHLINELVSDLLLV